MTSEVFKVLLMDFWLAQLHRVPKVQVKTAASVSGPEYANPNPDQWSLVDSQ